MELNIAENHVDVIVSALADKVDALEASGDQEGAIEGRIALVAVATQYRNTVKAEAGQNSLVARGGIGGWRYGIDEKLSTDSRQRWAVWEKATGEVQGRFDNLNDAARYARRCYADDQASQSAPSPFELIS